MRAPARILLVDNEPAVCRSCTTLLAADGHEVNTVSSGDEALDKIENDHFDVAVLDVKTAGSGGLRVLRAIRKAAPQTEVVVTTGYPSIANAKESMLLGAFDYMTKPFVPQALCAVVAQVLACKPWKIQERC
jgi:DNA-binding NtrC family response regulator